MPGVRLAGGLFRTVDAGEHWIPVGEQDFGGLARTVATDPVFSGRVLATTGVRVLRSNDFGATWRAESNEMPSIALSLAIDPTLPWIVYVGTQDGGVYRSMDAGQTWLPFGTSLPGAAIYALGIDRTASRNLYAGTDGNGLFRIATADLAVGCVPGSTTLCLADGRFSISVAFQPPTGLANPAQAVSPVAVSTGAFWFFDPANIELVVKVLDGRSINGKFWVFYGALSNVEYTITVTDMVTGAVTTYFNPQGQLASVADTSAF